MSSALSPPPDVYSQVNLITNVMRSLGLGYAFCVCVMCGIMINFTNRFTRAAFLPLISAISLIIAQSSAILIDIFRPRCDNRALGLYVFYYGSQICLEVYQTNRVRMLAANNTVAKSIGIIAGVFLFYYSDSSNLINNVCITVFPSTVLITEKCILLFYNTGNLLILVYLAHYNTMGTFLFQDGLTFIMALLLDSAYVAVIATVTTPWIMSLAAGLANGFNLAILHVKYCAEVKVVLMTLLKKPKQKAALTKNGGGSALESGTAGSHFGVSVPASTFNN
ncbi:hypothetical protein BC829DRAFT_388780 [Chytridium lagenaria]|nr:hypothetical protein BC829DRAFT_388780 [Chytridium lagenaria]